MEEKRRYGLLTAITMIVGIVIGSGIFFKSDSILKDTGGNVVLGIALFGIAAFSIIFGGLTLAQLAARTDTPGGLTTYAHEFVSPRFGNAMGWFQTFVYFPTIVSVVSFASGMYICQLFGWSFESPTASIGAWCGIGALAVGLIFIMNIVSAKIGGYFQNLTTFLKLLPLIVIAVAGFIWGDPQTVVSEGVANVGRATGWMAGIGAVAFSFDGWVVSTSICHEIKNSKRNLPLALTISPFIVLIIYIAYFLGISALVPPEQMSGNVPQVYQAANELLGSGGAKIILVFVVISMLGTLNGLILGFIRMPHSLAIGNNIPFSKSLAKIDKRLDMPLRSAALAFVISLVWILIHFVTQTTNIIGSSDVSEIAIVMNYGVLCVLYVTVMGLTKRGDGKGKIKGYLFPILAILGALTILIGALGKPEIFIYIVLFAIVLVAGFRYKAK